MQHVSTDINQLLQTRAVDAEFPCAPVDWTRDEAIRIAREEGLQLSEDHWETIRALQTFYAQHDDAYQALSKPDEEPALPETKAGD